MHVTELGMITLFKLLQLAKVEYLIVVTELGIIMLVRFLHKEYLLLVDYQYYTL